MSWLRAHILGIALAGMGAVLLGQGLWIQLKAELAQLLLQHAWQRSLADGQAHKPWPWADHWPVAELSSPDFDQQFIVLAGDSGAVLAFAPGHNSLSGLPGEQRSTIISGHRDTHFRWLKDLQIGHTLHLRAHTGQQTYRVNQRRILDSRTHRLAIEQISELKLVTCYPFDSLSSGGPLRFVVSAEALPKKQQARLKSAGAEPRQTEHAVDINL